MSKVVYFSTHSPLKSHETDNHTYANPALLTTPLWFERNRELKTLKVYLQVPCRALRAHHNSGGTETCKNRGCLIALFIFFFFFFFLFFFYFIFSFLYFFFLFYLFYFLFYLSYFFLFIYLLYFFLFFISFVFISFFFNFFFFYVLFFCP